MGVHSGKFNVSQEPIDKLLIFSILLESFLQNVETAYAYRFYFAFDHVDPVFSSPTVRAAIEQKFNDRIELFNRQRREASGDALLAGDAVTATLHWVSCPYTGAPAWAHSDAAIAAFSEGADFVFRTNDDSAIPLGERWVSDFVQDLTTRQPIPYFGVIGPVCNQGATWILTHDFTHRMHAAIFEYYYPRSLPNWSSDDWITYVYEKLGQMHKDSRHEVKHALAATRYEPSAKQEREKLLAEALLNGTATIFAFTTARNLPQLTLK